MKYWLDTLIALLATGATYLFGGWDLSIIVLVCFMVADYISGVLVAITARKLSSSVGFKGLAKKSVILLVIMLAVLLDRLINDGTWIFRSLCAYFYIANEGISILENAAELGIPVPEKLKSILAHLKNGKNEITDEPVSENDELHEEVKIEDEDSAEITNTK